MSNPQLSSQVPHPKWRTLPQVLHQILHIAQVPSQQGLLLFRRSRHFSLSSLCLLPCKAHVSPNRLSIGPHRLWHEIEIQKLHGLEFHLSSCGARFEERGYSQKAIECLEGACVAWVGEERRDEGEEGGGLDGGTGGGVKEVEEEL